MEVVYPRCCGLDVHKKSISACVVIREQGKIKKLEQRFGTYTGQLEELAEWLEQQQVTNVVMEATGGYWKPVWNVLEGRFDLMLVNPRHVKALSGNKHDRGDAAHLADLLQHGLLHGSYVPPVAIRELRDLTRNRVRTTQETVRINNRIQKILEEANIKLGSVASEVLGVSGRRMVKALIEGEQDSAKLADLALGQLKKKRAQLIPALAGKVSAHHRLMLDKLMRALEAREGEIAEDERDIRKAIEPFQKAVQAWMQEPGVDEVTAWSLVAEMGPDLAPFATAEELASWTCLCPGNHESAGKQLDGRTRKGNPWLRSAMCEAAWGASRTKNSYFHAQFSRISARRGPQRALLAVAHSMVVIGFYLIKYDKQYKELGANFFDERHREHTKCRAVKRLNALGFKVTLEQMPAEAAPSTPA